MNYNNFNNNISNLNSNITQTTSKVLFVADLPDESCEEDMAGLFEKYHYNTSRVTNRLGRAYALVHFDSPEWAEKARNELNGVKLTAKYATNKVAKPIRLCRYETKQALQEKREDDYKKNLLVKNLGKDVSAYLLWNTFRKIGDIRSSKLAINFNGESKGYGYVSFYHVSDAEKAKSILNETELADKPISIEFLKPGLQKKPVIKNNIYVKHFPKEDFTEDDLKKVFSPYGEIISIMVVPDNSVKDKKATKGFGFVCFKESHDAEKAQKDLNGKQLFDSISHPLYVNFAMRKEERMEHLQKKKEEQIKASYKMTIFCKVKENVEVNITNDSEFVNEIMSYFHMFFGENYSPKSLKPRIDTKTAFITLNSPNEVDQFMKAYNEYVKINPNKITLYFNQYKSKLDRINAANKMKNYNNFGGMNNKMNPNSMGGGFMNDFGNMKNNNRGNPSFRNYNDFGNENNNFNNPNMMNNMHLNPVMNNMNNMNTMNNRGYNNYNNFENLEVPMNNMNLNPMMNNMNMNMNMNINNNNVNSNTNVVVSEEDQKGECLDHIYGIVSKVYEQDAPKITGMLAELSLEDLKGYLSDPPRLQGVIKSAYNQLHGATD